MPFPSARKKQTFRAFHFCALCVCVQRIPDSKLMAKEDGKPFSGIRAHIANHIYYIQCATAINNVAVKHIRLWCVEQISVYSWKSSKRIPSGVHLHTLNGNRDLSGAYMYSINMATKMKALNLMPVGGWGYSRNKLLNEFFSSFFLFSLFFFFVSFEVNSLDAFTCWTNNVRVNVSRSEFE